MPCTPGHRRKPERPRAQLALVAGTGALLAMFGNPFFGKMSDRTSSQLGMRRPWMIVGLVGGSAGVLIVTLAPSIAVVLVGWCIAQLLYNALLAAEVAVLPDQVPAGQRGLVAGVLAPDALAPREAGRARAGMCRFRRGTAPAVPRVK